MQIKYLSIQTRLNYCPELMMKITQIRRRWKDDRTQLMTLPHPIVQSYGSMIIP